jgi:hypothetical protein
VNVNDYLPRVYPSPPCWALVADVYASELEDTVDDYRTINSSVRSIASAFRLVLHKSVHGFRQVEEPQDFTVVLMGRTAKLGLHHCGVFYGGKVLHALESGTLYQDLASLAAEYPLMEFWAK